MARRLSIVSGFLAYLQARGGTFGRSASNNWYFLVSHIETFGASLTAAREPSGWRNIDTPAPTLPHPAGDTAEPEPPREPH